LLKSDRNGIERIQTDINNLITVFNKNKQNVSKGGIF